jgi:hypothetical protein
MMRSLMNQFSHYLRHVSRSYREPHVGDGQVRARVREQQHRDAQHSRVMPALGILDLRRKLWATHRSDRWLVSSDTPIEKAPGHIQRMYRE